LSRRRRRAREKQLRQAFADAASRPRTLAAGSGLALAATLVSGSVAHAASAFEVDTTADTTDSMCSAVDDDCSLRGAITAANADPGSTITFASNVTGTITLGSGLPTIDAGETIVGPGADVLALTGTTYPVSVSTAAAAVSISGLSVKSGFYGVRTTGANPLTLTGMAISPSFNNSTGVFAHNTPVTPLHIVGSTISGAGRAGVSARGALTIENSTITGTAEYGVHSYAANTIENSTISGNQGGVYTSSGSHLDLDSSIVAGNTSSDVNSAGQNVSENFSLIGNPAQATIDTGTSGNNLNGSAPQLGPLADNGGHTKTMKPAAASPVVDKGKDYTAPARTSVGSRSPTTRASPTPPTVATSAPSSSQRRPP
jgi:CSLREA domain-containing protein